MKTAYLVVLLLLSGCARQPVQWDREGSTEQELRIETAQCREKSLSIPLALANQPQVRAVFNACMHGKGWTAQEQAK